MGKRGALPSKSNTILEELERFYSDVDALYAATSCPGTTECCRFGITGREPYVTSIELAFIERAIAQKGGLRLPVSESNKLSAERRCPLLTDDGRCSIYAARPFGCRTFFCERATSTARVKHAAMLERVRTLKNLADRHRPGGSAGRPLTRALPVARTRTD